MLFVLGESEVHIGPNRMIPVQVFVVCLPPSSANDEKGRDEWKNWISKKDATISATVFLDILKEKVFVLYTVCWHLNPCLHRAYLETKVQHISYAGLLGRVGSEGGSWYLSRSFNPDGSMWAVGFNLSPR